MTALKFFDSISADHTPVGNNAKAVDAKSLSDSIRYRDQRFNISRIAWPHFAADGLALIVDNGPDNHLIQIGSVVFAEPPFADGSALALEVDGGGIKKDQIQTGEQMPLIEENRLFYQILVAPGSKRRGSFLVIDLFSQKSHCPVKMMQIQLLRAGDAVVSAPPFAKAVRA
jgi:hypothetical protein